MYLVSELVVGNDGIKLDGQVQFVSLSSTGAFKPATGARSGIKAVKLRNIEGGQMESCSVQQFIALVKSGQVFGVLPKVTGAEPFRVYVFNDAEVKLTRLAQYRFGGWAGREKQQFGRFPVVRDGYYGAVVADGMLTYAPLGAIIARAVKYGKVAFMQNSDNVVRVQYNGAYFDFVVQRVPVFNGVVNVIKNMRCA